MIFKQPFYVSPHAITKFRERVAILPTKVIRTIIQAALQDNNQQIVVQVFDHKPCPVFKAKYLDIEYLIPVIPKDKRKQENTWPVVPTILLPNMRTGKLISERSGWRWN